MRLIRSLMASILVVGPHPDDQELGMGGTIAALAAQGHTVTLLDMTNGEPTPTGDVPTRQREAAAAARELGSPSNPVRRIMLGETAHAATGEWGSTALPNRRAEHSLAARYLVAGVMRAVQAEWVFVPYFEDAHPDHLAVTRIVEDARFDAKLTKISMPGDGGKPPIYPARFVYYYATHLRIVPQPSFIFNTTGFEDHKRRAILAYHSQFIANEKNRGVIEWVEASARFFGSRIAARSGEPFFVREPLGVNSLQSVL